jgi:oligosaccharyltransferase complex subunit epsilon
MSTFNKIITTFWTDYQKKTPLKLKLIDLSLVYVFITGVIQFIYCGLFGSFPFNSFLSGFLSTVGCFVLTGLNSNLESVDCFQ